jgi:predicted transcriptional regulator
MNESFDETSNTLAVMTAELVAAYVSNNPVPAAELPALIARVHGAISGLVAGTPAAQAGAAPQTEVEKPTAAQIRKSVRHDGIVSFIDGKTYKTLKRHLTSHGLDPRSYREHYGLPADYPMVAPSYAEQRSTLTKSFGLGVPGTHVKRRKTETNRLPVVRHPTRDRSEGSNNPGEFDAGRPKFRDRSSK